VFREAETAEHAESLYRQVDKARRKIMAAAAELTLESLPARDKALLHAAAARKQALHRQRAKILQKYSLHLLSYTYSKLIRGKDP
jgi:hypothetical protein